MVLPLDVETIIPEDDSVRTLMRMAERIDYTKLSGAYERENPREATPKQMFLLVVLLLHQLNLELSAGDKSSHTMSLNLEILPVFLRFRSLSGTISHPASQFTIKLVEQ